MSTSVLHVTDAAASGVLAAVTTLARAQSEHPGLEVTLAYVPRPDSPPLVRIQEMTGPGVHVQQWSRRRRGALGALTLHLARRLRRGEDDVLHLHSSRAGLIGRVLARLTGYRERTVYSPHCFAFDRSDVHGPRRALFHALERLGTRWGPRLVLVSETEEQLARRMLPRASTAVLRNRVDARALGERHRAAAADASALGAAGPASLEVVHVGRITAQKRPAEFAAIARSLTAAPPGGGPAPRFRWLGEGERELLGPEVSVSGWLDHAQLLEELERADVLLFTTAGEGLPIAVLEAQALGLPVIAHDVTGMADVVVDGVTGILRHRTAELEEALAQLARDPERRRALGDAARARIRASFDLGELAPDSLAAYRRLGVDAALPSAAERTIRHHDPVAAGERGTT